MTETHTREWKRLWKDDYLKWICGFANAAGGVLEIGRDDDGHGIERIIEACRRAGVPTPKISH